MRLSTIIIIVAALGVSVLTAFLIQWYLGSQTPSVEAQREVIPAERVLVAKADLPGGTVLKAKDHFRWQAWPASGLNKSFVLKGTDLDKEFVGAVVRREIKAGSPISAGLVYRGGEKGFLASGMKPGMLAVAVKVDPIIGVAGLVTPGDYVDVILTSTLTVGWDVKDQKIPRVKESRKVSETVLRNIRVLAVNQNADGLGKATKKPKTATLEVNEKQAEILANARNMGKLFLALRSHVPPELPAQKRDYPFTSDLEILSSLRGGLVSHINEQNSLAVSEFGLERWLDVPEGVANRNQPQPAEQPVSVKPKIRIQSPALRPGAAAPAATGPIRGDVKKAVVVTPKKKAVLQQPVVASPAKIVKKKPAVVKAAPAPTVAPVETSTVRVDRAGNIQILKFKEAQ